MWGAIRANPVPPSSQAARRLAGALRAGRAPLALIGCRSRPQGRGGLPFRCAAGGRRRGKERERASAAGTDGEREREPGRAGLARAATALRGSGWRVLRTPPPFPVSPLPPPPAPRGRCARAGPARARLRLRPEETAGHSGGGCQPRGAAAPQGRPRAAPPTRRAGADGAVPAAQARRCGVGPGRALGSGGVRGLALP